MKGMYAKIGKNRLLYSEMFTINTILYLHPQALVQIKYMSEPPANDLNCYSPSGGSSQYQCLCIHLKVGGETAELTLKCCLGCQTKTCVNNTQRLTKQFIYHR